MQERLSRAHGSQCGFCTPGFVMSMYSLLRSRKTAPTEHEIEEALAGNLWCVFASGSKSRTAAAAAAEGEEACPATSLSLKFGSIAASAAVPFFAACRFAPCQAAPDAGILLP